MTLPARQVVRSTERLLHVLDGGLDPAAVEAEYGMDRWQADRLGIDAMRGRSIASFEKISQPWLRQATKEWCRWRLATGLAFGSIAVFALTMGRFSQFLLAAEPDASGGSVITRQLIERYISWLRSTELAANSRALTLICLRGFLEHNRRHGWLPDIPAHAAIYQDDLPRRDKPLPRFVSEFVMAQLEDDDSLALLEPTVRHLVEVLMETGLRASDACYLPFNPLLDDSVGWPCLRYHSRKTNTDELVPLSGRAAVAIRDQQAIVRADWHPTCPWLFPEPARSHDDPQPFGYHLLGRQLKAWQIRVGIHDEAGEAVQVSAHQFRHTLGTRLINSGVPQHVVQRILGHASPGMTAVYAQLHDTTIRAAFDSYQQLRVDIAGSVLAFDPNAPTAQAEWVKHNLSRIQASLPNGYCGRPPQQECPHPNACLTCPDFQTTVEFLGVHKDQSERNRKLIATAEANGQFRLVENHRRVPENLERIIPALEAVLEEHPQ
jgi:integrase